ncbi:P-loop containing nucleoside triphosphate hydrolase protein [Aspergillus bertholletiae]|uniref:P-loop containing nucleoside triphosphate hydrolase protein n=1 Tax=Aspergillus bertholletiae TaxID=1226010 RepID=A0A5N7ASH8_9EURO|nr:P-loop containing nucleoside triphosphate hydrolase protein [Aspergillus bertholletiae]
MLRPNATEKKRIKQITNTMMSIPLFVKYPVNPRNNNSSCINGPVDDGDFGLVSRHCGDAFDLNLLFEQSFLSIAPSTIFLLVFIFRSWYLLRYRTRKAQRSTIWALKLIMTVVLGVVQLALVVLWSQHMSRVSLAAAILALIDSLALCFLSNAEHIGTSRTSTVINIYLFFSTLFDAVQCRTLWLLHREGPLPILFSAMIAAKAMALFLEAQGKTSILMPDFKELAPEATSGVFNRISFWWLNPLLIRGFQLKMNLDDLLTMSPEFSGERLGSRMQQVWNKCRQTRRLALLYASCEAIRWPLISAIFPRLCLIGFKFAQPFLLNRAVSYVAEEQSNPGDMHKVVGYGLIGSTALIYLGLAFCTGAYRYHTYRAITMVRGSLVVIIFRKTLALDSSNSFDNSASVTLMSTDIDGIASAFNAVHDIWAGPIEIALGLWLLERHVGIACIAPGLTALVCFLASLYISRFMGRGRREWNQAVQKRVTHTASFLSLMKEVKMLGLTEAVSKRIQQLRVIELGLSKKFRVMTAWSSFLSHATPVLSPIFTFGLYAVVQGTGLGQRLDVGAEFSSLSLISLLTEPASNLFHAIPTFASGLGCFERIQEFLLIQDTEGPKLSPIETAAGSEQSSIDQTLDTSGVLLPTIGKGSQTDSRGILLSLQNVSFGRKEDGKAIISGINLLVRQSSLTVITGKIGCGKSTLLKGILGEIPCSQGLVRRHFQDVAYCDQSPWLRNITIRQNIIGDSRHSFNERLYDSVIEACALKPDFSQFPGGDQIIVGSNGVALSGGQKQRITLARALYSAKRLMILDSVFSGLDSTTADSIFDNIFRPGGLKDILSITAIIVSRNVHHMQIADNVMVIGEDGSMVRCDTFDELQKGSTGYIAQLGDHPEQPFQTEQLSDLKPVKKSTRPPTDHIIRRNKEVDATRQFGDTAVYAYYLQTIGWRDSIFLFILGAVSVFCDKFPNVWLEWWVQDSLSRSRNNGFYFGIYIMFGVSSLILVILTVRHMFVRIVPTSSGRLHKRLLDTVMKAPLSLSLVTDIGVTLNRFSQDMTLVDMALPPAVFLTLIGVLNCLGGAVMALIGAKYLAIMVPMALVVLYCLQKFYLRTSRQLRFLDLETKSPLYSHFLETLNGLTTIRAFGWVSFFEESNIALLAESQRPYYLLYCIQRWLDLVLDIFVGALAVLLLTFALTLRDITSPGALGVAMINLLNFNQDLAGLIDSWTKMETSLGAIARLRDLETNTPQPPHHPHTNEWTFKRSLEFRQVSASYGPENPAVLSNVSLRIEPGKMIAITGRTGSGKSSVLLCLLGLLDLRSGSIHIDEIDISTISPSLIHDHVIIIPQNMPLLPGSVRYNLHPSSETTNTPDPQRDKMMISALEAVQLWQNIQEKGSDGLATDERDLSLSAGQTQLFSFARALVQKTLVEARYGSRTHGGIVVLDEPNSSVDMETSLLMLRLLAEVFVASGWTALVVTHRRETMGFADRVIVLDAGSVIDSS